MPRQFSLTFVSGAQEQDVTLVGEFSDEEYGRLNRYLEQDEELRRSRPLREGMPCEYKLRFEQGAGLSVETALPDDDTLAILLHRLRPFVLSDEPASFESIAGIVGRRVENPYFRQLLREQREMYDGRKFQQMVQISTQDGLLNSDRLLKEWLNSHEYHRDEDKRAAVAGLLEWLPGDFGKAVFISMLIDKVTAIRNLAAMVALVTGRTTELKFELCALPKARDSARSASESRAGVGEAETAG